MKKALAILTLIIMVITLTATACAEDLYELKAVVTAWERIGDTNLRVITVTAEDGNLWDFFDDEEEYKIGDVVWLTMREVKGHDEADEIVEVEKVDHMEPVEMARFLSVMDW